MMVSRQVLTRTSRIRASRARLQNRIAAAVIWGGAIFVAALFAWLMADILWHGWREISLAYFTQEPESAGRLGGISSILVSTGLILIVCLVSALPIGLGTAIFLAEYTGPEDTVSRKIRLSLNVLAGTPSIVFGLFGNAFFCKMLGMGFSILSGGLTLACMVLPYFIRIAEESIRSVPQSYRMGAVALGLSKSTQIMRLILPVAVPGILGAIILSVGRSLSETAALIFTSGYVDRMPESLYDSGRSLSVHIYDLSMNVAGGDQRAYSAALVLIVSLILINFITGLIGRAWSRRMISIS